jgi:CMP-N-acetylneuraminic acid synthetase
MGTPQNLRILGEQVATGTLRQELPKVWWRNGALYVVSPTTILEKNSLYSDYVLGYEMPYWQSHNIDNFGDLAEARLALSDKRISKLKIDLFS